MLYLQNRRAARLRYFNHNQSHSPSRGSPTRSTTTNPLNVTTTKTSSIPSLADSGHRCHHNGTDLLSELFFCILPSTFLALLLGISCLLNQLKETVYYPFIPRSQHDSLSNGFHARWAEATGGETKTMKAQRHMVQWEDIVMYYIIDTALIIGAMIMIVFDSIYSYLLPTTAIAYVMESLNVMSKQHSHWQDSNKIPTNAPNKGPMHATSTAREEYEARRRLRVELDCNRSAPSRSYTDMLYGAAASVNVMTSMGRK